MQQIKRESEQNIEGLRVLAATLRLELLPWHFFHTNEIPRNATDSSSRGLAVLAKPEAPQKKKKSFMDAPLCTDVSNARPGEKTVPVRQPCPAMLRRGIS